MIIKKITALTIIIFCLHGCTSSGIASRSDGSITPNPGKRSFGAYIDDRQITEILKNNIYNDDPRFEASKVKVYSFNKVVLLTGEVPSHDLKMRAGQIAQNVHSVRSVHNELEVTTNSTFMSNTNDTWIFNKVKAQLIADSGISAKRVEVIVENEVVYLMGLLTRSEANRVTNIVRTTSGVRKVIRVFEYID